MIVIKPVISILFQFDQYSTSRSLHLCLIRKLDKAETILPAPRTPLAVQDDYLDDLPK
jgi:hypothetical protein